MNAPMTNLSTFNFNSKTAIRIIPNDNPLFVAVDVARALGYKNTVAAINKFCKGVAKHDTLLTSGGAQKFRVIYEPDVYRLIFGSKLKSALKFQNWVFDEVLPSIRQTGSYTIQTLTPAHQRALQEAVANKVGHNRALFPKVWGAVKSHFRVGTYKDLPDTSFDDALSFIDGYMDGHDLIAARDISAEYRAHARKLEILYRRLGEGYRDPRATYSPTLPLDRQDIHDMKQIRNIQTDMDNLLLEMAGGYQC